MDNKVFLADLLPESVYDGPGAAELLALRRAVGKLIRFGEQVGVSPEEMIVLLDSGMSVRGLLYYLASQQSRIN
jgi:hypothetical protein